MNLIIGKFLRLLTYADIDFNNRYLQKVHLPVFSQTL